MTVRTKPADAFFKMEGSRVVDFGGERPEGLRETPAGEVDVWALVESADGPRRAFTFRAAVEDAAVSRARRRVETMEVKHAVLGRVVGIDPKDGEPVFQGVQVLEYGEAG